MKEIIIKTPQQARSRLKYAAILAACPRVLEEHGYKGSTTARIALEADVGIGTFYDYFSCKQAVYIAYLDNRLNLALENVYLKAQNKNLNAFLLLKELVRAGVDFAYDERDIIKLAFTHFSSDLHLINLEQSKNQLLTIGLAFVDTYQDELVHKDPELIMYTLTNLLLGFQFRIVAMPDNRFSRDTIAEEIAEIIRGYLLS